MVIGCSFIFDGYARTTVLEQRQERALGGRCFYCVSVGVLTFFLFVAYHEKGSGVSFSPEPVAGDS